MTPRAFGATADITAPRKPRLFGAATEEWEEGALDFTVDLQERRHLSTTSEP
jgi:hypothetical protein